MADISHRMGWRVNAKSRPPGHPLSPECFVLVLVIVLVTGLIHRTGRPENEKENEKEKEKE